MARCAIFIFHSQQHRTVLTQGSAAVVGGSFLLPSPKDPCPAPAGGGQPAPGRPPDLREDCPSAPELSPHSLCFSSGGAQTEEKVGCTRTGLLGRRTDIIENFLTALESRHLERQRELSLPPWRKGTKCAVVLHKSLYSTLPYASRY